MWIMVMRRSAKIGCPDTVFQSDVSTRLLDFFRSVDCVRSSEQP